MSNLFPNSAILSQEKPTQAAGVSSLASTAVNKKRTKAHRRHQRLNRGSKQIDTIIMMVNDGNNRVKLPKEQRRADKKNYKALVKKMKKQQSIAVAEKKKKKTKEKTPNKASKEKQGKVSESKDNGILPEERAYKRSLRLNRKDHALKEGDEVARKEVKISLVETLRNMQKEAVQKRKLAIMHETLPEERAYRQSIKKNLDDILDPCLI